MRQIPVVAVLTVSSLVWPTEGRAVEKILRKERTVRAPLEAVWEAWTSEEGLAAVSPQSVVELRPGGRYEWFLDGEPDPRGVRGSAGSHFVAVLPRELIAFRWTFPPSLPRLRESGATGQVIVRFSAVGADTTSMVLTHSDWPPGSDGEAAYAYFAEAWQWVLDRFAESLQANPQPESPTAVP